MASRVDILIDQGATFSTNIYIVDDNDNPVSLQNYTANSVFKKWYTSSNSIPFVVSSNPAKGIITYSLYANVTSTVPPGRYVYDLYVTDNQNVVSRLVEGVITFTPGVTTQNTMISNNFSNYYQGSFT